MSVLKWTPKNFESRIDFIKTLSIKHKLLEDDKLIIKTSFKAVNIELSFRNQYKHKLLECIIYKDSHSIKLLRSGNGYITGHEFILFLNRIVNNIEGI